MPHADPVGGSQGARTARVTDDIDAFKQLQGKMWTDKQAAYVGKMGTIELTYPNGDVAMCFDDGEWLRVAKDALADTHGAAAPEPAATQPPARSAESSHVPLAQPDAHDAASTFNLVLSVGQDTGFVYRDVAQTVVESVVPGSAAAEQGLAAPTEVTHVDFMPVWHSSDVEGAVRNGAAVRGHAVLTLSAPKPQAAPAGSHDLLTIDAGPSLESAERALREAEQRVRQMQAEAARLRDIVERRRAAEQSQTTAVPAAPAAAEPAAPAQEAPADAALAGEEAKKKRKKKRKDIPIAIPIPDRDDLMRVFEALDFGKRREDVEKELAAMGDPTLEDLEFWDLRTCTEELQPGLDQVALEMFYFGEIKEAGDANTFKVNVIDRLAKAGVQGIHAPCALKEAGCMYPLIGIPFTLPWEEGVKFGNLVFEDFGLKQETKQDAHGDKGKEGGGGGGDKEQGCGQQ